MTAMNNDAVNSDLPPVRGLQVVKVCAAIGIARNDAATNSEEIMVLFMVGREEDWRKISRAIAREWSRSDSEEPANTDSYCTDQSSTTQSQTSWYG